MNEQLSKLGAVCFRIETLFCPCVLLGNIETKLHREKPICPCSRCPECELGPNGFQYCAYTCCLTTCGWPISPCLSLHLIHLRYKIHLLYENDERLKLPLTCCRWLESFCCWCANLEEQYLFVNNLWDDNQLTFHWDFDRYRDHMQQKPTYPTQTVLIFAAQNFSTTTFMNKFLRHTSVAANVAATSGSSKVLHNFLSPEMIDLEHVDLVETGVKTRIDADDQVSFLEVWKIPPSKFHSQNVAKNIQPAVLSYYLFDLSDKDSIEKIKKAYIEHGYFATGRRVAVVIGADNQSQSQPNQQQSPDSPSTRKKKSVAFTFDESEQSNTENTAGVDSTKSSPRREELSSEGQEHSPLVTPKLTIHNKGLKEIQNWARQHSAVLYEVSLPKQDDFTQLNAILEETLKSQSK